MFLFALDNRAPSFIVLLLGDVDFSNALHILGQRGYTIMVVRSGGVVSPALINAGHHVLDWHTVASGRSFVLQKPIADQNPNLVGCLMSSDDASRPDIQNKEKMVISNANFQPENCSSQVVVNEVYCNNSTNSSIELCGTSDASIEKVSSSLVVTNCFTQSSSQGMPSALNGGQVGEENSSNSAIELYGKSNTLIEKASGNLEAVQYLVPSLSQGTSTDLNGSRAQVESVIECRQRRLEHLKVKIWSLIESCGGCLHPALLCSEYQRQFGEPLCPDDYGFPNVERLVDNMNDKFILRGRRNKRKLYRRFSYSRLKESAPFAKKKFGSTFHNNPDLVGCPMSYSNANRPVTENDAEMAVSKANVQPENPSNQIAVNDVHCDNSSNQVVVNDLVGCPMSCSDGNRPVIRNDDEMAVSKANIQPGNPSSQVAVNVVHCDNSSNSVLELNGTSQSLMEKTTSTLVAPHYFTKSISAPPERNVTKCAQPMKLKYLKRRINMLIKSFGGSLLLMHLCSEYYRKFGEPLNPHAYGVDNVVKLASKMTDKFILNGIGNEKSPYVLTFPDICKVSIPTVEMKNKEITHANEMEAKNKDPQLYALLTEAKNEEHKLDGLSKKARIEDSDFGETDYFT